MKKRYFVDASFQEVKIWKVPESKDKPHGLKYSFAYIVKGERVVGYDNAEGKGDHRHYIDTIKKRNIFINFRVWKNYGKILKMI